MKKLFLIVLCIIAIMPLVSATIYREIYQTPNTEILEDTYTISNAPTTPKGSETYTFMTHETLTVSHSYKLNISASILTNYEVLECYLNITQYQAEVGNTDHYIYEVYNNVSWTEDTVTHQKNLCWAAGKKNLTSCNHTYMEKLTISDVVPQPMLFNITRACANTVKYGYRNVSLSINGSEGGGYKIGYTKEAAQPNSDKPTLIIVYNIPTPPPPSENVPSVSMYVNATDSYNNTKLNSFTVTITNATKTYIINTTNGLANISNLSIASFNATYNFKISSNLHGSYHNITYNNVNLTEGLHFSANLSKYYRFYEATFINYSTAIDTNNYTRNLTYRINFTCPNIFNTYLATYINGTQNTSYLITCSNETFYFNGSFTYDIEAPYDINFALNSTHIPANNTFYTVNSTFISDLNPPEIVYLNLTVNVLFGLAKTNISIECSDTIQPNLTNSLVLNNLTVDSLNLANGTFYTKEGNLTNGNNVLVGTCSDLLSNVTQQLNYSILLRSIILIDEKTGELFNLDNVTVARAYFDDNQSYIDLVNSTANFTILDAGNLRFEFTYSNSIITRYADLTLTDPTLRICINKEGVTHYEQLVLSATEKAVVIKNVFSNCIIAADYTRFAYQDSLALKYFTTEALYYLYTYSGSNRVYLASLDGSITTYIDIDQLEFGQTAYDLSVLDDAITFQNLNTTTTRIYYLNKEQDNIDLSLTITNMLTDVEVLSLTTTDFSDYNEFTIYFDHSTLANVTNETVFKLDLLRTTSEGQSTLTRYFNINSKSGVLQSNIAVVLGFLLSVFGLTLASTRITFSWFGILVMIASIALLSFAVSTWYITFLIALDAIVLIYIALITVTKNYSTLT